MRKNRSNIIIVVVVELRPLLKYSTSSIKS